MDMSPLPNPGFRAALNAALVNAIKSEMGVQSITPTRLASLLGEHPQHVTSRLTSGNPRTGKRVELSVEDVYAMCGVLNLDPLGVILSAQNVAAEQDAYTLVADEDVADIHEEQDQRHDT